MQVGEPIFKMTSTSGKAKMIEHLRMQQLKPSKTKVTFQSDLKGSNFVPLVDPVAITHTLALPNPVPARSTSTYESTTRLYEGHGTNKWHKPTA